MFCFWPNCSCRELITSESNSGSVCLVGFNFDNDVNVAVTVLNVNKSQQSKVKPLSKIVAF